ncbi:MAG TPA: hypothetical protein VFJ51_11790 [Nitrososphaeraceae archaeon]|nr:hypothetical protein [Nitrososphaeraceae archaeon]
MGSPRHWNVERHILRLHGGLGEPVNEFGKTREQCQIDMNLQYGHNHQDTHKLAAFRHDQYKESRFSATHNYGTDNNNKFRWDFMDDIIEPAKKNARIQKSAWRTSNAKSAPISLLLLSFSNSLSISIASVYSYQLD